MKTVGIICEYNPFHLGHRKQIRMIRSHFGPACRVVCLMSGNFVQRGQPAIFDKSLRAEAALRCGADLVLELPVTAALSSAEGFAANGVQILSRLCDVLCFGAESGNAESLTDAAKQLLSAQFPTALHQYLDEGLSFPAARAVALEHMGCDSTVLHNPNDILAVEYCKAVLRYGSSLDIFPVARKGSYHAVEPDRENPSATAVRECIHTGMPWKSFVPAEAAEVFSDAAIHSLAAGERAVLSRLWTMDDEEFEALPYGSEGLWRRFMHQCRMGNSLEQILVGTKSKRYTRSRLDRMCMCAFLGITEELITQAQPYVRILGFTDRGREVLRGVKKEGYFLNAGEPAPEPWWTLERRWGDLYGLFRTEEPAVPGSEERRRVLFIP